jgi:hypothetical protein
MFKSLKENLNFYNLQFNFITCNQNKKKLNDCTIYFDLAAHHTFILKLLGLLGRYYVWSLELCNGFLMQKHPLIEAGPSPYTNIY